MRRCFVLSLSSVLAGAMLVSAAAADSYFRRWQNGSWTNVEYNDGACYYFFAYNSYDQTTRLNRNGDCLHVAIGPDGNPTPIYAGPVVVRQRPLARVPIR